LSLRQADVNDNQIPLQVTGTPPFLHALSQYQGFTELIVAYCE